MSRRGEGLVVLPLFAALLHCRPVGPRADHSALVPGPRLPRWDGAALGRGGWRAEGGVTHGSLATRGAPQRFSDSGLHVATTSLHADGAVGVSEHLDLAVEGELSPLAWSRESVRGTLPLPEDVLLWGLGLSVRGASAPGDWRVGGAAGARAYSVRARRDFLEQEPANAWLDERLKALLPWVSVQLSWGPESHPGWGRWVVAGAVATSLENDGFGAPTSEAHALDVDGTALVGAGWSGALGHLRWLVLVQVPADRGEVRHGPALTLSVGLGGVPAGRSP